MATKSKTYTPMPEVPPELRERYAVILQVISGQIEVSEGARRLKMSRNHFQSIMHKALEGMIGGLTPRQAGRPCRPAEQVNLEKDNERLRRENDKLRFRVDNFDRLLGVAAEVLNRRMQATPTGRKKQDSKSQGPSGGSDEDDPAGLLRADEQMRDSGLCATLRAALLGVGVSTLRRWRSREKEGVALRKSRGPRHRSHPTTETVEQVSSIVRQLRGLVGAESLSHSVDGLSRRQAAAIKLATLADMERERLQAATRVDITTPGVVRGMDAMHVSTADRWRWILVFADAAVPFRTSILVLERYDEHEVAAALERDLGLNGAPLVLRCDRWRAHRSPEVLGVARRHGVLLLSGPAHHPCFYGQLERQNREHRAWLDALGRVPSPDLQAQTDVMTGVLNTLWKRRTLGWSTAEQVWNQRPELEDDRCAFAQEVEQHMASIESKSAPTTMAPIDAERFAIEAALRQRGYLRQEAGGWC